MYPHAGQWEHFAEHVSHTTKWQQGSNKTSFGIFLQRMHIELPLTCFFNGVFFCLAEIYVNAVINTQF